MKKLIMFFLIFIGFTASAQYPIQTIFKGDSVVILTIEQSKKINNFLEKNKINSEMKDSKINELENKIDSLNRILNLKDNLLEELAKKNGKQKNNYTELLDTLWSWSLGPTLLFSDTSDNNTIYVYDLSDFWVAFYNENLSMSKMTDWEYKRYFNHSIVYNTSRNRNFELKFQKFDTDSYISSKSLRRKKLWRNKRFGKYEL